MNNLVRKSKKLKVAPSPKLRPSQLHCYGGGLWSVGDKSQKYKLKFKIDLIKLLTFEFHF